MAVAGVVLLRGNRWRTGALLAAALAVSLALLDAATNRLKLHALDFDGSDTLFAGKEITVALDQSPAGRCMLAGHRCARAVTGR